MATKLTQATANRAAAEYQPGTQLYNAEVSGLRDASIKERLMKIETINVVNLPGFEQVRFNFTVPKAVELRAAFEEDSSPAACPPPEP